MKNLMLVLAMLISIPSHAGLVCKAKFGFEAHDSFCQGLPTAETCKAHRVICDLVRTPSFDGGCFAELGYEVHDSYCQNFYDQYSCSQQNDICRWLQSMPY